MSAGGSSVDNLRQELEELVAETARLREQSRQLEERIAQLVRQCEQRESRRDRGKT
jgi:hypothetical protein